MSISSSAWILLSVGGLFALLASSSLNRRRPAYILFWTFAAILALPWVFGHDLGPALRQDARAYVKLVVGLLAGTGAGMFVVARSNLLVVCAVVATVVIVYIGMTRQALPPAAALVFAAFYGASLSTAMKTTRLNS